MHLLASTSASIDDLVEAVDLRQSPGDIVILSFADSDLSGLAAAWAAQRDVQGPLPRFCLANAQWPLRVGRMREAWYEPARAGASSARALA